MSLLFLLCWDINFAKKGRVIITDGDLREMNTINECIKNIFLDKKGVRCGCNIVDSGWGRHLRCMIFFTKKAQIKMFLNKNNNTVFVIFMNEKRII